MQSKRIDMSVIKPSLYLDNMKDNIFKKYKSVQPMQLGASNSNANAKFVKVNLSNHQDLSSETASDSTNGPVKKRKLSNLNPQGSLNNNTFPIFESLTSLNPFDEYLSDNDLKKSKLSSFKDQNGISASVPPSSNDIHFMDNDFLPPAVLSQVLDKLSLMDTHCVFSQPVDVNEVPDYYDVIKHPMDFATIKANISSHFYTEWKKFEDDCILVFSNAMKYNKPNTYYHKLGKDMKKQFVKIVKETKGKVRAQSKMKVSKTKEESSYSIDEEKENENRWNEAHPLENLSDYNNHDNNFNNNSGRGPVDSYNEQFVIPSHEQTYSKAKDDLTGIDEFKSQSQSRSWINSAFSSPPIADSSIVSPSPQPTITPVINNTAVNKNGVYTGKKRGRKPGSKLMKKVNSMVKNMIHTSNNNRNSVLNVTTHSDSFYERKTTNINSEKTNFSNTPSTSYQAFINEENSLLWRNHQSSYSLNDPRSSYIPKSSPSASLPMPSSNQHFHGGMRNINIMRFTLNKDGFRNVSYAQSIASFAKNLGPVGLEMVSKKLNQLHPLAHAHGHPQPSHTHYESMYDVKPSSTLTLS